MLIAGLNPEELPDELLLGKVWLVAMLDIQPVGTAWLDVKPDSKTAGDTL